MTDQATVPQGAYVHRLTRGYKRWFFNLSLPHDYLDWLADPARVTREPDLVAKEIAKVIDDLCRANAAAADRGLPRSGTPDRGAAHLD